MRSDGAASVSATSDRAAGGNRLATDPTGLKHDMLNFELESTLPDGGRLWIRALRPEQIGRTADLLADAFARAQGFEPYT